MRRLLGTLMTLALLLSASAALAQKSYKNDDLASAAIRLEEQVHQSASSAGQPRTLDQMRRDAGQFLQRGDGQGALQQIATALTAAPQDAGLWLLYAHTAVAAAGLANADTYTLDNAALAAAYLSYERATRPADEAAALAALGEIYAGQESWRPSLNAYRASLDRLDNPAVRSTYEAERAAHGFRIVDYKVDSDSASPRVCFQFSDPLARGKVDFAPFVTVSGSTNAAISTEEQQLCVEGLEHGQRYAIVLREGLPSAVGEQLLKSADYDIYVRDRAPQVRFTARNYVLPRVGQQGIPVVSVNTTKVALDVLRIGDRNLLASVHSDDFLSQIGSFREKQLIDEDGVKIWSGTLDVQSDLNNDVTTAFPVLQAVGTLKPGVYVMIARAGDKPPSALSEDEDSGLTATQWFVVSDLGLTAFSGEDGVLVLVRSLATAQPLQGIELSLVAHDNEILATATTATDGSLRFDPGLTRGTGGTAPGLVVARTADGDYNFLDLAATAFDLTDRGVNGRTAPHALDAYLFAERGVYRSGETVDLTALLRDAKGVAVAGLPLTLVVKRPDGVEYKRAVVADQGMGGRAFSLALLAGAQTGTWRVTAFADPNSPPIGAASFLVEDYVPERLDLKLTPQQPAVHAGETTRIEADARYLYGAPGAGLDVSGDITVEAASDPSLPGLPGFVSGLQDEDFDAVKGDVDGSFTTDDKGHVTVAAPVPDVAASRPLEAKFVLRAAEPGGRAVERTLTLPILPKNSGIGVKKDFSALDEGATATFDVVAVTADGKRTARQGVHWSLYRISNDYQWYNSDGRWNFERVKSSRRIADGTLDLGTDAPGKIAAQVGLGQHRLDLKSDDSDDAPTSIVFDVGWGGEATADTPDLLDVTLDKADYRLGEAMKLRIASRFAGAATIVISGDKIDETRMVDLKLGDNDVTLPVGADWGAGAYAIAIAHRPLDAAAKRMPGRALGLAWFAIDEDAHKLAVTLDAPAKIAPRQQLTLPIRLAGLAPGEEAQVTVAAVDVGILNLTGYKAPDPTAYFFGQRQLSVEIRDLYGLLIDGMQGAQGAIHSGGDQGAAELSREKPTQEPLARYSGVVKVAADGTAQVTFDIPAFNGTVRVMAVAWSKTRVGSAQADIIVRDPIVVTATLPRFLALGDQSRVFLQIDNVEGAAGDYSVDLDIHGPIDVAAEALHHQLRLAAGGHAAVTVPVTAAGIGPARIDLELSGQGVVAAQSFALAVESGTSDLYRRSVREVPPGTGITISSDLLADFLPGSGAVSVAASPLGAIDVPALLQALDRYPYGCSEQVVSAALPLLYANKLAAGAAMALDGSLDDRIRKAIELEMARQDSSGAFGLWSSNADTDDLWLDAYVSDFLTRARENGFAVPQLGFGQALDHLRNAVANATDIAAGNGEPIAYAIYVLARNGRPVMGDLRYLTDTKIDAFTTPLARAQLAAGLALLGDRGRAEAVFATAAKSLAAEKPTLVSRPDYGSRLRDSAGLLALGAEAGLDRSVLVPVSLTLEQEQTAAAATSTQEEAWMVLAAEALSVEASAQAISVDGVAQKGAYYNTWRGDDLAAHAVTIRNDGEAPAEIVITTSGNPVTPEPAAAQGYQITRSYYRMDGSPADSTAIHQNDRLVVVLKMIEPTAAYARLLLVDRLPAGLEIDNPDLFDGGSIDTLSWIKGDISTTHSEYRDDRFVAAFERDGKDAATFAVAYIVRAVTPGHYVLPPATIEDMYRPQRFGRTAFGTLDVAEKP